jgi:hypothetical protein
VPPFKLLFQVVVVVFPPNPWGQTRAIRGDRLTQFQHKIRNTNEVWKTAHRFSRGLSLPSAHRFSRGLSLPSAFWWRGGSPGGFAPPFRRSVATSATLPQEKRRAAFSGSSMRRLVKRQVRLGRTPLPRDPCSLASIRTLSGRRIGGRPGACWDPSWAPQTVPRIRGCKTLGRGRPDGGWVRGGRTVRPGPACLPETSYAAPSVPSFAPSFPANGFS